MNTVVLMGRITADPELKQTESGKNVTSFTIAVDRGFKDNEGERQTDFINVVAWRQTAEFICKYFEKGAMIALNGRIQTRSYEDKNGNKRTAFEVVAEHCYFTGGKKDANAANTTTINGEEFEEIELEDDELPF